MYYLQPKRHMPGEEPEAGLAALLCERFSLKTPVKKVRSKASYIALLEKMVSFCFHGSSPAK